MRPLLLDAFCGAGGAGMGYHQAGFDVIGVDINPQPNYPSYFAVYGDGGGKGSVAQWQQAMGMDWTDVRKEIAEAIPPLYAQFVGAGLLEHMTAAEVAA